MKPRTTVSIEFTGLALCFHSKTTDPVPIWNVVLICDAGHRGHIEVTRGPSAWSQDLYDPHRDLIVKFASTGFDQLAGSDDLGDLLNLQELHNLIPKRSKLKIDYMNRPLTRHKFVWIQIPYSAMVATNLHDVVAVPTIPALPFGEVFRQKGQTAFLTFYVCEDFIVEIDDYENPGSTASSKPFPVDGTPIEFRIDNTCDTYGCTRNDFDDVYDFLTDRRFLSRVQFQTWAVIPKGPDLPGGLQILHDLESLWNSPEPDEAALAELWFHIMSPQYGNCDPIGIDPPPCDPKVEEC